MVLYYVNKYIVTILYTLKVEWVKVSGKILFH